MKRLSFNLVTLHVAITSITGFFINAVIFEVYYSLRHPVFISDLHGGIQCT